MLPIVPVLESIGYYVDWFEPMHFLTVFSIEPTPSNTVTPITPRYPEWIEYMRGGGVRWFGDQRLINYHVFGMDLHIVPS